MCDGRGSPQQKTPGSPPPILMQARSLKSTSAIPAKTRRLNGEGAGGPGRQSDSGKKTLFPQRLSPRGFFLGVLSRLLPGRISRIDHKSIELLPAAKACRLRNAAIMLAPTMCSEKDIHSLCKTLVK